MLLQLQLEQWISSDLFGSDLKSEATTTATTHSTQPSNMFDSHIQMAAAMYRTSWVSGSSGGCTDHARIKLAMQYVKKNQYPPDAH